MKVEILDNNWTIQISDVDVNNISKEEARIIGKLFLSNLVLVIKNQKMTPDDVLSFCQKFGNVDTFSRSKKREQLAKSVAVGDGVARVTGALNEDGKPGLFGMKEELDWHTNGTEAHNNTYHGACFYGVKGTAGSRTSWMNLSNAYNDLPENIKDKVKNLYAYTRTPHKEKDDPIVKIREKHGEVWWEKRSKVPKKVHLVNEVGVEGMVYPHLFMDEFVGYSDSEREDLHSFLSEQVLKEKYHYHHDWEDGDIVLSEQRLTQHKRWAFEEIENRLLYRTSFDFRNISA